MKCLPTHGARRPLLGWAAALLLVACAPRSALPEGDHDALRYRLPLDYVERLEQASLLEVIAIDRDGPARCGEQEGRPVGGRMILRHRAEMLEVTGHLYQSLLDGVAECSGHVELALIYEAGGRTTRIAIAQDGTFAHIRPARRTESFAFASSPFWSRLRARAAGRCDLPESPRGRDRPGD